MDWNVVHVHTDIRAAKFVEDFSAGDIGECVVDLDRIKVLR